MISNRVRNPMLIGFQRGDGVFGPLIVRTPPKVNWHNDLYDIDEHIVQISDWTHELGIDKFLNHHHAGGDNKPPNILINGLGRFTVNRNGNNISAIMPTAIFMVKQVMLNKWIKKIYIYNKNFYLKNDIVSFLFKYFYRTPDIDLDSLTPSFSIVRSNYRSTIILCM